MNKQYRTTLIATAAAALISAPAWSAIDSSGSSAFLDDPRNLESHSTDSQSGESRSMTGAQRARASDNKLYEHTPDELTGFEVVGTDGKSIGKIAKIVLDRNREDAHAVIASGGIMGMGTRQTLVPLAELTLVGDDKVQANLNKESIAARPEFKAENYGVMESDRRISDFSAFEPTAASEQHAAARAGSDMERSAREVARTTEQTAEERPSRLRSQSETAIVSLEQHTPGKMKGMEVVGKNCQSLGSVKSIVSSRDRDELHAVITSGGFLGLGSREILVPLNELEVLTDSQLQADFNQDAVESRPEFEADRFRELDSDRPISEQRVSGR